MDNRDFWPYMRVAKLPDFNPSFTSSSRPSHSSSFISRLVERLQSFYRFCYVHLHDLILSSLFGYLTLNEKLYVAVHQNEFYKVRRLLSHGASPSFIPVDYKSIFTHLIKNNNQIKNYYVETSLFASILASDSMLYMAVSNNSFNLIKELINYHDYGQKGQHTEVISLCLAVKRSYTHIVKYLINYGHINPNDCVQLGCKHCKTVTKDIQRYEFPLYHACRENHIDIVKYLIEIKRCDINQLTTSYETCLHGAILGAIENRFDTPSNKQQRYLIVQYLLKRKDCNLNLGLNPLCVSLAHDNIYDYTSLLLQYKCNVNRLGWNLYETVTTNCNQNNYSRYLLDHPLNMCLRRLSIINDNSTAGDQFWYRKHAKTLIEKGSYVYAMYDYDSVYPFLLAVQSGDKILVEAILINAKSYIDLDIIEPLICACTKSYHEIVQILVDFGFSPNTIMINHDNMKLKNPVLNDSTTWDFLKSLDRYCTFPSRSPIEISSSVSPTGSNRSSPVRNIEQQTTAFLALSRMPTWIFHQNTYDSTIKTIENLFSHIPIQFSIRPNRLAFYYALLNEHVPIVYYCLAHFCPVNLLHNTIEFTSFSLQTHFSYTLFHLISLCCRLTSSNRVKRALFDSYAKTILKIYTYDRTSSINNVLAYMKLWFDDQDFVYDQTLFEHLMSLPYIDNIIEGCGEKKLRSLFGLFYQRIIERRPRLRSMHTLKHICRLKIRDYSHSYCERRQINMLKIIPQITYLPKTLQAYIFYTSIRSNSLINSLLNNESWNNIRWM